MLNEDFVAENMGEFPKSAGKFFPKLFLEACAQDSWDFTLNSEAGRQYIMGIDYGLLLNPTQITVFEVLAGNARLVYWEEISPVPPEKGHRDYDPIIERITDYEYILGKFSAAIILVITSFESLGFSSNHCDKDSFTYCSTIGLTSLETSLSLV